jgi:dolichyl-phosphate beta-glucosyltransferase
MMTNRAPDGATALTSVSVVVPAYNEARSIEATIGEICSYLSTKPYRFEVIVSADGNDGTRDVVRALGAADARIKVIGSEERAGKGRGVREGVRLAQGDVIGFVDADNKTPIQEFDKFEDHLAAGVDVVIGSRALRESRVERAQPMYRRIGSKVFAAGMHTVVGLSGIADTQCGFKFFRRRAALDLFGQQRIDGYMFDVEILHLATQAGYRIVEVPVRWRDDGDSRLQLVSGNVRNFLDLLRIRFGRYRAPALAEGEVAGRALSR